MSIHPTAIVDSSAEIDATVEIGAYAIVEGQTRVGAGTVIHPHGYVARGTTLGRECQVHPYAVVGHVPQDVKFDGAPSYAEIGDGCIIREGASVHRGSEPDSKTVVGKRVFIMAGAHVGHNCVVGDDVVLTNAVLLGGHVSVGERAFLGGGSGVHQFVRVGELAMIHGLAVCVMDLPPFMMAVSDGIAGLNTVGLRRAGMSREQRAELGRCFRMLYRSSMGFREAIEQVAARVETAPGRRLAEFLQARSLRGFMKARRRGRRATADGCDDS